MNRKTGLLLAVIIILAATVVFWYSTGISPVTRAGEDTGSASGEKAEADSIDVAKEDKPFQADSMFLAVGEQAPDFTLTTLDGKKVSLSDYRGKKVLLNFWASWCPPCRAEMPDIQSYHEAHSGEVAVLAVNIMYRETEEKIRDFLEEGHYTFTVLLDKNYDVQNTYKVRGVPTSYFIDSKGIIRYYKLGPLTEEEIKRWMETME
ncbi:TlpA family protein disulfide reductase [Calderihabitans maritimus]|uniref:Thiol:disulfide interchange protein n=1 Tax=Calderihabitans maritimus TaxID=1246530 RepID=A0A1Z5HSN3_9FIRM|nr:TlpA disulfide reductase family protein [Calderihabitans maritimus]GAW92532.1 thiol:disulfide interchange protein [Calderihabitans maritimus]